MSASDPVAAHAAPPDPGLVRGLVLGIDLGTTHSLVAVCDEAGPRVLADESGRVLLPSVARLAAGSAPIVGEAARAEAGA
ncbi:MAG: Hsp70 family protein, partial [Phycisphaerales bacterium]